MLAGGYLPAMAEPPILPGAEAMSAAGGPTGVLVIHGFTGSPQSMRPIAEACAAAGHTVEMPRLPGHGTTVEDILTTSWADWSAHVEAAYSDLASRCDRVIVTGLSMGGALTLWLASRHPEIDGIAIINSAGRPDPGTIAGVKALVDSGQTTMDAVGNDIAKPGVVELAYDATPLPPLLSLLEAVASLDLAAIRCPAVIVYSEQDHVVPPDTAAYIADSISSDATLVALAESYHVATLDHEAERIVEVVLELAAG